MAVSNFFARLIGRGEASYNALQKKDDDFGAADIQHLKDQAPTESLHGKELAIIEDVAERMLSTLKQVPLTESNFREVQLVFAQASHQSKRLRRLLVKGVFKYNMSLRKRNQLLTEVYVAIQYWRKRDIKNVQKGLGYL